MRGLLRGLAVSGLVLGVSAPARAQQGSIQITGSAHALNGDSSRIGDQERLESDAGVSWLQPGVRGGILQLDLRGTQRDGRAHMGKAFAAWRNVKLAGATWSFEAGDLYFTPVMGDYRFANLATPAITFAGGAISARTARSSASAVVGRVTASRNIFGSDADTLGQEVGLARATHKPLDWLEINARASRIRTTNVKEFGFTIAASDQAGGGARLTAGRLQVVADSSVVSYRRAGSNEQVRDGSVITGASLLLARGWVQVNVARFSPGDFPLLNYPLLDRQTAFAAGEYELFKRVRVFAGVETFRANLDPLRSAAAQLPQSESTGHRGFGSIRLHIAGRSSVTVRVEEGDRKSQRIGDTGLVQSDTGALSTEFQSQVGLLTSFLRYSRRQNDVSANGSGGYTQDDGAAQMFVNVSKRAQLFGTAIVSRNRLHPDGGETYYQFGGGGQTHVRSIWLRGEAVAARNLDRFTEKVVARTSFDLSVSGEMARNTTVGFHLHADRLPPGATSPRPWITRSLLRVTRSFATGSARVRVGAAAESSALIRSRGTGSVAGVAFEDWNADGIADPDERMLEGIPILLGTSGSAVTAARGEFAFVNVPVGVQRVALDVSALPVDFDPPDISAVQVEVGRDETRRVTFALVPLGTISGRVWRDANGNGQLDADDEPVEGAVLVLDEGARSEQVRKGRFRFDAVRSGLHTIELLPDSLPEGATILGEGRMPVPLTRAQPNAAVDFLVKVEQRPELRRVFPRRDGGASPPPVREP